MEYLDRNKYLVSLPSQMKLKLSFCKLTTITRLVLGFSFFTIFITYHKIYQLQRKKIQIHRLQYKATSLAITLQYQTQEGIIHTR